MIWERVPKDTLRSRMSRCLVSPRFARAATRSRPAKKRRSERVLPNSAVTVALGHLMMASDIKYLTEILQGFGQRDRLASSADYKQMEEVMNKLAPGERSGWPLWPQRRRSCGRRST